MAAQNTDKLRKVARKWVGQVGAGGVESGTVTTVPLASTTNLPTETAIMITIDRVDANGVLTPDKEEGIIGVVSGDNLSSCIRGVEGTAQAHSAGAVVEVLWTARNVNDIVDAILAEHSQSGAHTTDTINEKTEDAGVTVDGVKHKDSQVYTDQINEKTEDAGVKVDGVLLKDSFVSATQPSCGIGMSSSFTAANGTYYTVAFGGEQWDTHGFHDNTTNNSRITIPTGLGGRYLMTYLIKWAGSATGWRRLYLTKDGVDAPVENFEVISDGDAGAAFGVDLKNLSLIVSLTAGSYYEIKVAQGSGGDLTCYSLFWQIYKLP